MPDPKATKLDIDALKREHARLDREKTTAEANLKMANDTLDQLRAEAKASYDTDDLEQLKKKLEQMQADNERKRAEYQAHLDKINTDLKAVEQTFGRK